MHLPQRRYAVQHISVQDVLDQGPDGDTRRGCRKPEQAFVHDLVVKREPREQPQQQGIDEKVRKISGAGKAHRQISMTLTVRWTVRVAASAGTQ